LFILQQMAEQLLLHGDVFENEFLKLSYGVVRMDICAALLAYLYVL